MQCHKCDQPSAHSIQVRDGTAPLNPSNPKTPDKSTIRVVGLCSQHWEEFQQFLKS